MTHHTHLVQRRLAIEQDVTRWWSTSGEEVRRCDLLSVLQMSLDDPPILQERVGTLVVLQIYTFTGVSDNVSCTRVRRGTVPDKLLQIGDVVRRDCHQA